MPELNPTSPALSMPLPPPPPAPTGAPAAVGARPVAGRPAARPALRNVPGIASASRPWTLIFSLLAVFIVMVGTFIIYFLNVSTAAQIKNVQLLTTKIDQQIAKPPLSDTEATYNALTGRLKTYKTALTKQIDYAAFLDLLPKSTPKDMSLSSLAIDEKGTVHITGKTLSFEAAAKALISYRELKYLSNVKLNALSYTTEKDKSIITLDIIALLKKEALSANPTASPSPTAATTGVKP